MSIQTITTILTHQDIAIEQLDAAISFARACDAHLQVLPLGIGFDYASVGYGGFEAMPSASGLEQAERQASAMAKTANARLAREDIRWDVEPVASFMSTVSFDIIRHIKYSDLVVQVRPSENQPDDAGEIAETVLFKGDAPLLLLPSGTPLDAPAQNIMVAWDESGAALRATRQAMPFLQQASQVYAALIDPPKDAPDRSDPGGAFAQFLARHDVKCEVAVMTCSETSIAQTLCQRAQELGCDMIVMGAYGHSRLREALFGGTTRTMLQSAKLPVLFAH